MSFFAFFFNLNLFRAEEQETNANDRSTKGPNSMVAVRLPVEELQLDDDEALKMLLLEHGQLEEENTALRKLFRELKRQLKEQEDQFDRETGRLYDFVKAVAVKSTSSVAGDQSKSKDDSAKIAKQPPSSGTAQVTYKRVCCFFYIATWFPIFQTVRIINGKMVPRYTPEIVPTTLPPPQPKK